MNRSLNYTYGSNRSGVQLIVKLVGMSAEGADRREVQSSFESGDSEVKALPFGQEDRSVIAGQG